MRLAFDIDDVLLDFVPALARFHNEFYSTNLSARDFHTYYFSEVWGGTSEDGEKKVNEFLDSLYFREIEAVDGAADAIEKLTRENKIYIVTSRPERLSELSHKQIKNNFWDFYEEILFAKNGYCGWGEKTKAEICEELGVEVLVEDSPKYCNCGDTKVLLFDRPWNREAKGNFQRVYSWKEIGEILT